MDPVLLATIHHEGAGKPTDEPRGAAGGYTYWIGTTRYERLRTVWSSFATLGYNHHSLDLCLSGDRMVHPVTDAELGLIRAACVDARRLGYVIDRPRVRAHKDSPGSSTVCPGVRTMARWDGVVLAVWKPSGGQPAPNPGVRTMPAIESNHHGGYWIVHKDGAVYALGGAEYHGGANNAAAGWPTIVDVASSPTGKGYWLLSDRGNVYAYGDAHFAGGAPVVD